MNLSKTTTREGVELEVVEWEAPLAVGDHTISTFRRQVELHNQRLRNREQASRAKFAAAYQVQP